MSIQLLAVLNVGPNDVALAIEALHASARLCGQLDAMISIANPYDKLGAGLKDVMRYAEQAFSRVELITYDEWGGSKEWPAPQNHAWQQVARRIAKFQLSHHGWLWWEPDAVPLRAGWLEQLSALYTSCNKAFAGYECLHHGTPYMNGVGIYPMNCVEQLTDCSALYTYTNPFDIAAANCTMRSFRRLNGYMLHEKKATGGTAGRSFTKATAADLLRLNPSAVFYHGCTDSSLHQLIGSRKSRSAGKVVKQRPTFYHSGDLGDLIYALPLIKKLGGGKLFLGPYLTSDKRIYKTRIPLDQKQFDWIAPLLRCQPYLDSVDFTATDPGADYDLNLFRSTWFSKDRKCTTLTDCYFEHFNAGQMDHIEPWLTVPQVPRKYPVVIHRSGRYRNNSFPWREMLGRYSDACWAGTQSERLSFELDFGVRLLFPVFANALELAQAIAAAQLFIGNQSFPNALALALGTRVIQETCAASPDCVLMRPGNSYLGYTSMVLAPIPGPTVDRKHRDPVEDQILLGPCANAYGLGDTLTITPVAKQLGNKCRMQLPHKLAHLGTLFEGLCPVQLVEDFPVWPCNTKHELQTTYKLRHMGLDTTDNLPVVKLTQQEIDWGRQQADANSCQNDVVGEALAFSPTCADWWAHSKMRDISYWEAFFAGETRTILQFGRKEYPTLKGAVRMPFYNLRELASVYSAIGQLVSVDTGDLHLMLAVGGRCFVTAPEANDCYDPAEWQYQSPRIVYSTFDAGRKDYMQWRTKL